MLDAAAALAPLPPAADRNARHAQWLAGTAVWALRAEARLTPKPALVDRRGSGAHTDMDLLLLLRSSRALHATFAELAQCAAGPLDEQPLRDALGRIGRAGERRMLSATGGVNTHRGAIWSLGLLCAASARRSLRQQDAASICEAAARIAVIRDSQPPPMTHGRVACLRFAVAGARGEAQQGFPHVRQHALPALLQARTDGHAENIARLDALIALMAVVEDTCVLHRAGAAGVDTLRSGARRVQDLGGAGTAAGMAALLELDTALLRLRASPGGCADLLAAALFLDRLERTWKP